MWIFDEDVPLAYFPHTPQEAEQEQATMPRTGVAGIPLHIYLILIGSAIIATGATIVIRKQIIKIRNGK
ncbi:MAG: hypothetical protein FWE44_03510, partial [Defluviitaleaceae bacterium]|nr:hypothetical protein [Defluviitaleaceae bacterium]